MSRVRGSMVRTVGVAVFVGIAWSASTVAAQAAPAVVDVSSAFTPRQVNPSGPLDPRCILAQGNPICANGPWVADPNATPNPLPKGPAGGDLNDPTNPLSPLNPGNPQNEMNPANPLSPLNPTSPTNPMNTA
jgi:hypothetical protein